MAIFTFLMKKMSDVGYSMETFWKVGIGCFGVIALMTLIGLVDKWNGIPWYLKVSSIGTFIFQCSLAYLFFWLLQTNSQKTEAIEDVKELMKDKDMLALMKVQDNIIAKEGKKNG